MVAAARRVTPNSDYAELRRRVVDLGLLDRHPGFYARELAVTRSLAVLAIAALVVSPFAWTHLLVGVLLAFATGRIAMLLHDAAHRQIWPPGPPRPRFWPSTSRVTSSSSSRPSA